MNAGIVNKMFLPRGRLKRCVLLLKIKNFLFFTISDLAYWVALTFITTGLVYYMTALLQMDKAVYSQYMIILFALSFIVYVPFNVIDRKIGKKKKRFKIIFINKDDQSNPVLASGNPCGMKMWRETALFCCLKQVQLSI